MTDEITEATEYAAELAENLADRFYPEIDEFEPLYGDLHGLLSQIDNMTTGLVRLAEGMVIVPAEPTQSMIDAGARNCVGFTMASGPPSERLEKSWTENQVASLTYRAMITAATKGK